MMNIDVLGLRSLGESIRSEREDQLLGWQSPDDLIRLVFVGRGVFFIGFLGIVSDCFLISLEGELESIAIGEDPRAGDGVARDEATEADESFGFEGLAIEYEGDLVVLKRDLLGLDGLLDVFL